MSAAKAGVTDRDPRTIASRRLERRASSAPCLVGRELPAQIDVGALAADAQGSRAAGVFAASSQATSPDAPSRCSGDKPLRSTVPARRRQPRIELRQPVPPEGRPTSEPLSLMSDVAGTLERPLSSITSATGTPCGLERRGVALGAARPCRRRARRRAVRAARSRSGGRRARPSRTAASTPSKAARSRPSAPDEGQAGIDELGAVQRADQARRRTSGPHERRGGGRDDRRGPTVGDRPRSAGRRPCRHRREAAAAATGGRIAGGREGERCRPARSRRMRCRSRSSISRGEKLPDEERERD